MSYWVIWPIGIVLWLAVGWFEFGYIEAKALHTNDPNKPTLSRFIYTICTKFPLAMAIGCAAVGMFWGILWTHLFWHWCPPGSITGG